MVSVQAELEIKYDVEDDFELPSLTELLGDLSGTNVFVAGETSTYRLEATYLDTADHRLAAGRLTLRRRTGGTDAGWHLKVPGGSPGARQEIQLPIDEKSGDEVPEKLRDMVWPRTHGAPLVPVARLTTRRSVQRLTDGTGRVLLEVADDRVEGRRLPVLVRDPDETDEAGEAVAWREIEAEVVEGDPDLLERVDATLQRLGLRVSASASKVGRLMRHSTPEPAPSDAADAPRSASEVVLAYLREQGEQVVAHDVLVRLDHPDSVHKMRVATRRIRSALKTFKPLFDTVETRPLRSELKWLAGELGAARDAEVLRARLQDAMAAEDSAPNDEAAGSLSAIVTRRMDEEYDAARSNLLTTLDSERYRGLVTGLATFLETPPLTDLARDADLALLTKRVRRSYANLRDIVKAAADRTGEERDTLLHEARKAAKQARYAGEAVTTVFGSDAAAFARAMEDVQEELGEHQDSVVMRAKLASLAEGEPSEVAFAVGALHAREEARGAAAIQRFDQVWVSSSKKSLRTWLR